MACNVYLTFLREYDVKQLRLLEWKYILFCYGTPFIPAFAYCFVKSESHGKVYGSAVVCHAILLPTIRFRTDFSSCGVGLALTGISCESPPYTDLSGL